MHTSPNHRLLLSSPPLSGPGLSTSPVPLGIGGRASARSVFLVFGAGARGSSPVQVLSSSWKKKKRRPAVKIINRKAYVVLSWAVPVCEKAVRRGRPSHRMERRRRRGVWASGSLKEESVKSEEFWRVARNIGQRARIKKRGWVRATICHGAPSLCMWCVLVPRGPAALFSLSPLVSPVSSFPDPLRPDERAFDGPPCDAPRRGYQANSVNVRRDVRRFPATRAHAPRRPGSTPINEINTREITGEGGRV